MLLESPNQVGEYIIIGSIINSITDGHMEGTFRIYFDRGVNFFDLSAAITLSSQWFRTCEHTYEGAITSHTIRDERVLLHLTNGANAYLDLFEWSTNVSTIIPLESPSHVLALMNSTIVYAHPLDTHLFHSLEKLSTHRINK